MTTKSGRDTRQDLATFVLVHGSWHDGSAWSAAIECLEQVGHSAGGTTISKAVEAVASRARRPVYVSGFVPNDAGSQYDMAQAGYHPVFDSGADSPGDTVAMPFEVFRTRLSNDANTDVARWIYDQLSPEPYAVPTERMDFKALHRLPTPKSYILQTEDIALALDDGWGWHPRFTRRLAGICSRKCPAAGRKLLEAPPG